MAVALPLAEAPAGPPLRVMALHALGFCHRLLSPGQIERLRWELTELLTPEDDVLFIPTCERCHQGIRITRAASIQGSAAVDDVAAPCAA